MKIISNRVRRAFTLIELMIAMAMFTAIMIAVYSSWKCIVSGTRVALQAAGDAQRARIAVHTIEQALITAQMYDENNQYYQFIVDSSGKFSGLQMTCRLPGKDFLGTTYFGDEVVRQVAFFVERDSQDYNKNNLVMAQVPILDALEQNDPYKIVLARDVTQFELEYWKPGDKDFNKEFTSTNNLPKLVRINLGIGHAPNSVNVPFQYMMRLVNIPVDQTKGHFDNARY